MKASSEKTSKERFKYHLRKIGSGQHTSRGMSREEAAEALHLMLTYKASPAQIGAFMIAHRIRRPEPQELAGMLDTYLNLGPKLLSKENQRRPLCFGMPFDGRKRTAPIYPLTALILISAGQPVVLQGGARMPIKYGITTEELFRALNLNLQKLTLKQVQRGFWENGIAFIYQPDHFPLADNLNSYRDEIGKRSTLASIELLWTAHRGKHLLVSGFVHPPTEMRAWKALSLMNEEDLITIKGSEGGIDLSTSNSCITGHIHDNQLNRLILHPREHLCFEHEAKWEGLNTWKNQALQALENKGALLKALRWNAGAYLWFAGITETLNEGIELAAFHISSGLAKQTLERLIIWRAKENK